MYFFSLCVCLHWMSFFHMAHAETTHVIGLSEHCRLSEEITSVQPQLSSSAMLICQSRYLAVARAYCSPNVSCKWPPLLMCECECSLARRHFQPQLAGYWCPSDLSLCLSLSPCCFVGGGVIPLLGAWVSGEKGVVVEAFNHPPSPKEFQSLLFFYFVFSTKEESLSCT